MCQISNSTSIVANPLPSIKARECLSIVALSLIVALCSLSIFVGLSSISNYGLGVNLISLNSLSIAVLIGTVSILAVALGSVLGTLLKKQYKKTILALLITITSLAVCSMMVNIGGLKEGLIATNLLRYNLTIAMAATSCITIVISSLALYLLSQKVDKKAFLPVGTKKHVHLHNLTKTLHVNDGEALKFLADKLSALSFNKQELKFLKDLFKKEYNNRMKLLRFSGLVLNTTLEVVTLQEMTLYQFMLALLDLSTEEMLAKFCCYNMLNKEFTVNSCSILLALVSLKQKTNPETEDNASFKLFTVRMFSIAFKNNSFGLLKMLINLKAPLLQSDINTCLQHAVIAKHHNFVLQTIKAILDKYGSNAENQELITMLKDVVLKSIVQAEDLTFFKQLIQLIPEHFLKQSKLLTMIDSDLQKLNKPLTLSEQDANELREMLKQ